MKKIGIFILLLIFIMGLVVQISKIKEINYVESVVIENYLSEVKAGNENTKYALSERHRMYINDKVIIRFNTLGGRKINIEKLSRFLKNADYLYYEIEKQSSLIKKIEEYNDRYLTRRVVFYFPAEGDYRRNHAYLDLSLGKIHDEWIVLGSYWDIQIEKNGKPSEFEITEPRNMIRY